MTKYLLIWAIVMTSVFSSVISGAKEQSTDITKIFSEMRLGLSSHDVGVFANSHEDGFDVNCDLYFVSPSINFLKALKNPRPFLGFAIHSEGQTHQFYGGLSWNFEPDEVLFVSVGLGGGIHTGELDSNDPDEQRLGSRALFRFAINLGFNVTEQWNVSFFWDHMSNAHLADPNNGLDKMGLQVGYAF